VGIMIICMNSFSQNRVDSLNDLSSLLMSEMLRIDSIEKSTLGKDFSEFKTVALNGDVISEKNLNGKVTLVNFWFETCAPCIAELGALSNLFNEYKDNPDFLFLSFTVDNLEVARKAVEKYDIPFIVCSLSREEASRMNFSMGFPTNIILNRERKIVFFKSGGSIKEKMVEKQIKEIGNVISKILINYH